MSNHTASVRKGTTRSPASITTTYALLQYLVRARERALAELAREHHALELERAKSERLLLNVLPQPVAARLKEQEGIIAEDGPGVTVLFADIVGFTPLSERLSASELVSLLDRVFAPWDAVAADHGVEKIKTIGDAYMVASGIPLPRDDQAEAIAEMALAMGPEDGARLRPDCPSRYGSESTPVGSSPASSGGRSSSTTCGGTRSTPPAAWNPTPCPAQSKSPSRHTNVCDTATISANAA